MMLRFLTGIFLAAFAILAIFFTNALVCKVIIIFLSALLTYEMLKMLCQNESIMLHLIGILLSVIGTFAFLFRFHTTSILSFFILVITSATILQLYPKKLEIKKRVENLFGFSYSCIFIAITMTFLGLLFDQPHAKFWIVLTLACTFMADTFAYLVGSKFGTNKLIPEISPNKTIEGLVGGIFGSVLAALVTQLLFYPEFSTIIVILLSIFIALLGLVGDLHISLLKRSLDIKDSGKILPGHGGVLDRFDSLLFTGPFVYLISLYYL